MPWPTAVATDSDLYVAVNALSTTLNGNINNSTTTVVLTSAAGFPSAGFVSIDNEIISYTGISVNTLTGVARGADGSSAASHTTGTLVLHNEVAAHHNILKNELENLETDLSTRIGVNTSQILIPSGSSATPQLAFASSTTTGLYRSAANELSIATAGTQRLVVQAGGNVGIGTGSPSTVLHVSNSSYPQLTIDDNTSRTYAWGVTTSSFRLRDVNAAADRILVDTTTWNFQCPTNFQTTGTATSMVTGYPSQNLVMSGSSWKTQNSTVVGVSCTQRLEAAFSDPTDAEPNRSWYLVDYKNGTTAGYAGGDTTKVLQYDFHAREFSILGYSTDQGTTLNLRDTVEGPVGIRYLKNNGVNANGMNYVNTWIIGEPGWTASHKLIIAQDNLFDAVVFHEDGQSLFGKLPVNTYESSYTPIAQMHVKGFVDRTQFLVQGNATQTSDLQQWMKSDATVLAVVNGSGSFAIGHSSANASSILDVASTTQGFLPPRMTTTQRNAISSPAEGLVIYNTTTHKLNLYTTTWEAVTSA